MLELRTMAQKADAYVISPDDLANEWLYDDDAPPRPRVGATKDPDAEALEIIGKVREKMAVAQSLARIATSVVRSFADEKMAEIVERDAGNALAHVERARRVATAAKEAAIHAASLAAARAVARATDDEENDA